MSGKQIDGVVRLLREYREAPKFSNDHDAIKRTVALEDEIDAFLAAAPALAQQPAAVDEAMVERAWVAFCENNGSARQGIRAALTAALATQRQEPKP